MLVLTRKKEEKLQIGNEITITVLRIKGNSVQLGIEAPKSVRVMRQELLTHGPRAAEPRDMMEIEVEIAEEAELETPKQPTSRLMPRSHAGNSLHAVVAQVFKPASPDRLMSV